MSAASGTAPTATNNVNSLEACMDLCNQAGATCAVAYWASSLSQCSLYPAQAGSGLLTPNSFVGNYVRTARLLTSTSPSVIDATYLLAPGYDLNLCGGPNANYYDRTFVGVYGRGSTGTGGPFIQGGYRNDVFLITCAGYSYYTSSISGSQVTTSTAATTYGFGGVITTADDCARLCEILNAASGYAGGCRLWEWYGANTCNLYSSRPAGTNAPSVRAGVLAAGISRASSSFEFTPAGGAIQSYRKRSLPPGVGSYRQHPRDALIDTGYLTPDVILEYSNSSAW
ncbi:hypothetical protein A1O7_04216 [Cladophialophora yegresii CBS 114405]|uniref:Uncharacterized protein n=1 Tax=Cladophialophora yegresii CBS 114405 TaxID=1182544 RepID=W9W6B2_9EURO|nr:uncharacterized protein A1O7_04216 [Cladophialophora yegresii CBS 114405]EXJ60066.1 hypothetical protein A1O7_04216 [Cladophialophora yegresii CBS 114405]